jgi:tRNA threonylcarbamoyladenosine biosynthesis protein TsaE
MLKRVLKFRLFFLNNHYFCRMKFEIKSISDLSQLVDFVHEKMESNKLFLLKGEMGVGKTTFVQALLKQLEIEKLNGSPTYSLINTYVSKVFGEINHLDLYRLNSTDEAFDIGIEEILDGNSISFIEWPEKIEDLIQEKHLILSFKLNSDLSRTVEISQN